MFVGVYCVGVGRGLSVVIDDVLTAYYAHFLQRRHETICRLFFSIPVDFFISRFRFLVKYRVVGLCGLAKESFLQLTQA